MTLQSIRQTPPSPTPDVILARLDAVMRELQALRQTILVAQPQPTGSIVDQLWGALGQGTPEELAELAEHEVVTLMPPKQQQAVTVQVQNRGRANPHIYFDDVMTDQETGG